MTNDATTTRPAVLDSKDQPLELRMRVVLLNDLDEAGKPTLGTIVNLRHTRNQVVVLPDGLDKLAVRAAKATRIKKNRSGKIERVAG